MKPFHLTPEQPAPVGAERPGLRGLRATAEQPALFMARSHHGRMSFQSFQDAAGHLDVAGVLLLRDQASAWITVEASEARVGETVSAQVVHVAGVQTPWRLRLLDVDERQRDGTAGL